MSQAELSTSFNTCTPAKKWCDYQVITGMVQNWVGGSAEGAYPPAYSPLDAACKTMKGATSPLDAWQKLLAPAEGEKCLNVTWESYCYGTPPAGSSDAVLATAAKAPLEHQHGGSGSYRGPTKLMNNGWDYLACTTEVHPVSNFRSSVRSQFRQGAQQASSAVSPSS